MKTRLFPILAFTAALFLFVTACAGDDQTYRAGRYDVNIAVQPDGALNVTETVVFNFQGEPFTYVFREIPTDRTDGITNITASMDGVELPRGEEAGQVQVSGRRTIEVRWHFPPTTNSTHTFVLNYIAQGVVSQETNADQLRWYALPNDYEYAIDASTVNVTWQDTAAIPVGAPIVEQGNAVVESGATSATFTAINLEPETPLLIGLNFPRGSVLGAPPAWQAQELRAAERAPLWIGAGVAILLIGMLLVIVYGIRWRRDPSAIPNIGRVTRPPSSLAPALAGVVNGSSPSWSNALGTLFDLAQRGILTIHELAPSGIFQQRDFEIARVSEPTNLRPHERGLVDMLFSTEKGARERVRFTDLSNEYSSRFKLFSDPLRAEVRALGGLDTDRERVRRTLTILAAVLFFLSIAVLLGSLFLIALLGGWVLLVPIAMMSVAIVAFIVARSISPLNAQGVRLAAQWQAFHEYLKNITRGKEPAPGSTLFEAYLPYAASFGLAEAWSKKFRAANNITLPAWFHTLAGSHSGNDNTVIFIAMMSASHSTFHPSAGAGGGGGVAAGGGSSGAG